MDPALPALPRLDIEVREHEKGEFVMVNAHDLGAEALFRFPTFRVPTLEELKDELRRRE